MEIKLRNLFCCKRTVSWRCNAGRSLAALLALGLALPAQAELVPYEARYSIYRNGKLTGKLDIRLQNTGGRWEIQSEGGGTHGLARILRASDREQVTGYVEDGRFVPQNYVRHTRVAGIDDHWETTFDWPADAATVVHDGSKTYDLALGGEALDPLSLKLEMRRRLNEPNPDLHFHMVEEDEIDEQQFRTLDSEWMETSLGCFETLPIEKVRTNSKRYTRAWHAPVFGNIEVRIEHGKTGGDHLEMRITELTYDGEEVQPSPGCSAMQNAARPGAAGDS